MKELKRGEDSVLEELVGDRDSVRNKLQYQLKDEGYTIIKVCMLVGRKILWKTRQDPQKQASKPRSYASSKLRLTDSQG